MATHLTKSNFRHAHLVSRGWYVLKDLWFTVIPSFSNYGLRIFGRLRAILEVSVYIYVFKTLIDGQSRNTFKTDLGFTPRAVYANIQISYGNSMFKKSVNKWLKVEYLFLVQPWHIGIHYFIWERVTQTLIILNGHSATLTMSVLITCWKKSTSNPNFIMYMSFFII